MVCDDGAMNNRQLRGSWAAAVTPLRDGGDQLDEGAFGPLMAFYGEGRLDGVLALGTTGEGVLLSEAERRRVAELMIAHAGPLGVIVHCGAQSTRETVSLAAHAAEAGADGVAVIAPPYFAFSGDELVRHYIAAARACAPLPFYVYEFAARSGYAIAPDVITRIREQADNLTGLKVSDTPFDAVAPYLTLGLDVFVGAEGVVRRAMQEGAVGAVSGLAACFPRVLSDLVADPTEERSALAEALRQILSAEPFPASVKVALGLQDVAVKPDVRAPLLPLDEAARTRLSDRLRTAGAVIPGAPSRKRAG